jgi:hypothetical protein
MNFHQSLVSPKYSKALRNYIFKNTFTFVPFLQAIVANAVKKVEVVTSRRPKSCSDDCFAADYVCIQTFASTENSFPELSALKCCFY